MSDFAQGAAVGLEANKQNPFNLILKSFNEAQARRHKEDTERKKEEAELSKALMVLQYKDNYDRALGKEKAKEEKEKISFGEVEKRKSGLLESIRKGEVQEAPPESEIGGNVFEGTPFGATGRSFKSTKTTDVTSAEGLSSEQQVQGRALAKKFYGTRGIKEGVPAIFAELKSGKTIDQLDDELRFAGQSPEFAGPVRDAAQTILINTSEGQSQKSMDYIDDLLTKGDIGGVKDQLKRLARGKAGMEEQRAIIGKERTIKLLDEIQDDLNNLEKMGFNTNIFTGTTEQIASKAGTVGSPEARKLATKISAAIQNYRRSMTGVQFGMPENKEYKIMFPSISRTANFNTANINGLKEVMSGDLDNFYSLSMGEGTYKKIFGGTKPAQKGKTITLPSGKTITMGQ